ncbi:MAG TPA: hypothetical protein VME69_06350 [Methylocella sp.]|nr:hypothetical protein [Methylocella sp.]
MAISISISILSLSEASSVSMAASAARASVSARNDMSVSQSNRNPLRNLLALPALDINRKGSSPAFIQKALDLPYSNFNSGYLLSEPMSSIFSECKLTLRLKEFSDNKSCHEGVRPGRKLMDIVFIDSIEPEEISSVNRTVPAGIDLFDVESTGSTCSKRQDQKLPILSQQGHTFNIGEMGFEDVRLNVKLVSMQTQENRRG